MLQHRVQQVLSELDAKRTRLIEDLRELDRNINLIKHLDSDNHELKKHIHSTNQKRRQEAPMPSGINHNPRKRGHSPAFSEDGEISSNM